jgi:hypothetical protein
MTSSYPIGSSVLLHNLVGASHLNGTKGIVKGKNNGGGRQEVYVFEAQKSMAIKITNLQYEPRTIQSLTVSEMKGILRVLKEKDDHIAGMDKEALRKVVEKSITLSIQPSENTAPVEIKIAEIIARANEPPSTTTTTTATAQSINSDQLRQGAERMASMSPDDLRKQATTMRAMGPVAMRAMNPQMANMSDTQIEMAIAQMEAVANDPNQLKMAAEQMKNMSEGELNRALEQQTAMMMGGGAGGTSSSSSRGTASATSYPPPSFSAAQLEQATKQMSSMSPEQLRQQATMLRSMPVSTLRATNPAMSSMSDAQIEQSISQLEMMANNPDMLRMATESMKGLTPEQLATMQEQMSNILGGSEGSSGGGELGSGLFTDPTKLNSAVKAMKKNPDILKQMLGSAGGGAAGGGGSSTTGSSRISESQMAQMNNMIDSFTTMDDERLEKYLHVANVMQRTVITPFMKTKDALGLSTRMALILVWFGMTIGTCMFGWLVWQWWFSSKTLHDDFVVEGGRTSILSQDELPPDMSNSYYADSEF